jgi:hypothetical protein
MVTAYLFEWHHLKQTDIQSLLTELSWMGWADGGNVVYDTAKGRGKLTAILVWHTYEAFSLYMETVFNQVLLKNGLPMPSIRAWPVNGKVEASPPAAARPVFLPKLDLTGGMQNPGL